MRLLSGPTLAAVALALSACVAAAPLQLPDDHAASPKAPAGLAAPPVALDGYKAANDFDARAAADANAPPSAHAGHGGMNMPADGTR